MTLGEFKAAAGRDKPPTAIPGPLLALWWDAKGHWEKAHDLVADDPSRDAAWVHAYLHRREGDLGNAAYWYRKAGRPAATSGLDGEWAILAEDLLERFSRRA